MDEPSASAGLLENVIHACLRLGRLLLANGADTAEVHDAVTRLAGAFGCEAQLLVTYESLVLTVLAGGRFRTKAGRHLPAMNVNMQAIEALHRAVDEASVGKLAASDVSERLERIERGLPSYPRWAVILGSGVAAGSLAMLLGGAWGVSIVALFAGGCGIWMRQELARCHVNTFFIPFVAALIIGLIGGVAGTWCGVASPALGMIAPALLLVPGVPLINGIRDSISNHMTLGLARLNFAACLLLAICAGLLMADFLSGAPDLAKEDLLGPSLPLVALLSAIAGLGFVLLFNVPLRYFWPCMVCAIGGNALRAALTHAGVGISGGTLAGALLVGALSLVFARHFRAPEAAFAFPGVIALVPGTYAFTAVVALLRIVHAGSDSSPALIAGAMSSAVTTLLMTLAIAIGLAAPLAFAKSGTVAGSPVSERQPQDGP
jgi:uncharacterized membrane protein YjjP (DUF1212 family)